MNSIANQVQVEEGGMNSLSFSANQTRWFSNFIEAVIAASITNMVTRQLLTSTQVRSPHTKSGLGLPSYLVPSHAAWANGGLHMRSLIHRQSIVRKPKQASICICFCTIPLSYTGSLGSAASTYSPAHQSLGCSRA